jgi:hypothetical protein
MKKKGNSHFEFLYNKNLLNSKRSQAINIILVFVIIVAIVLIILILKNSFTGNVVSKEEILQEECTLSEPLVCLDNSIVTNKGIMLFIKNKGKEDILLQKIKITNCLEFEKGLIYNNQKNGILIKSKNEDVLTISCDNKLENIFEGDVEIIYEIVGSSAESKSTGNILRKVL